jgi:hypothetical protein
MVERPEIIGKNDNDVKLFKVQKQLVKSDLFKANALVQGLYGKFFDRNKDKIIKGSVFISLPSTSRVNTIPALLGKRLAKDFKGHFIDGRNYFDCNHDSQAKTMLSFEKRVKEPVSYYAIDSIEKELESISGKKVYLVDDVLGTGESIVNFASELKKYGIETNYLMCLKNVEVRYCSQRDMDRLFDKLERFTIQKRRLKDSIKEIFAPYPKMKINRAERGITSDIKARKIVELIFQGSEISKKIKQFKSVDNGYSKSL